MSQKGFVNIFGEDYVCKTLWSLENQKHLGQQYDEIPEELSDIYMKTAQEDKTLLDKWEAKKKIKSNLIKRFGEYRQRMIKKNILKFSY